MKTKHTLLLLPALAGLLVTPRAWSQAVAVTMRLDATNITTGQGTTLHIFAQVVPSLRTNSDRIFSWYVDVLNTNGAAATANYAAMQKTASDNDPQTSSTGVTQGSNRRTIYDTFLNFPGSCTTNPVELMAIPVTGGAGGRTRFMVQAGTGASLGSDFQVVSKDHSQTFTGGDYSAAFADLTVTGTACTPTLHLTRVNANGGPGGTLQLTFSPCPGFNNTVEARAALGDINGWSALPGAPHNSGSVTVTNGTTQRYFRIHVTP